ncbi:DNA-binding transcriptional regulator, MarR family [Amycolatopsis arida]|uniref:DNA-binding transcriptional regulator, MarR family n=1 Tax=Amycolatopsis arida TaxID=587909 RepID=A0A1I5V384_9PSEU|nr:MarR family transcriptional regulator [Amycolatopsis arida]TDX91131.1 DNA-binding MarR family transcriptional regulator [Amycolatopsis arida]SFQ01930.1 DNA-binding transcriptional regulator, MarR family [Amycolatopsis arida]
MPNVAGDSARDPVDEIQLAWARELPEAPVGSIGVITRIWWAAKIFGDRRRRLLREFGVDVATLDLLSALRRAGPPYEMSPGALAGACMVTRGAVTQRVDRAAAAGLVTRPVGSGRRVRAVRLTDDGHALLDRVVVDLLGVEQRMLDHLTSEQQEQLSDLLRVLLAGLDAGPVRLSHVGYD